MKVEKTKFNSTQVEQNSNAKTAQNDSGIKFSEELKDLEKTQSMQKIDKSEENVDLSENKLENEQIEEEKLDTKKTFDEKFPIKKENISKEILLEKEIL